MASYDAAATMKVPGVVKVVAIDGTPAPAVFAPKAGIAVIANNTWAALKGREALKIVWDDGPNGSFDSVAYKAMLEENVRKPGKVERNEGDVDAALFGREGDLGGILFAPLHSCPYGAALGHRTHDRRQVGDLDVGAKPGRCP